MNILIALIPAIGWGIQPLILKKSADVPPMRFWEQGSAP